MRSATDFWFENFGRIFAPDASGWFKALMGSYPHAEKKARVRFGGSEPARFLICASQARAWAPVRGEALLPEHVSVRPTSARKRRDWILDVILDPPDPPFLAASIGLSGADAGYWRLTTSRDLVAFGGAASLFEGDPFVLVERRRFQEAMDWFSATGAPVSELLRFQEIRRLFQLGACAGFQARAAFDKLRTSQTVLKSFPGGANPCLTKLAAYAADVRVSGAAAP